MVEQLYVENIKKILRNKKEIERTFQIKILNNEKILTIESINSKPENEIKAISFFEALDLGFSVAKALELRFDDIILAKIPIKKIAHRKNLSQVRGRVIGKNRKAMDTIEYLSGCDIALHNNVAGIIGNIEQVKKAEFALRNLIAGSKHSSIYSFLEKKATEESF
jgi:ribosomal RNA assembly protein